MYKLCEKCKGHKVIGYAQYPCRFCDEKGVIEYGEQNDGKQNEVQNTKNTKRKKTVDTSAPDSI